MHVNGALLKAFPDFLCRKPRAREITQNENGNPPRRRNHISREQSQRAAGNRQRQLRLPFFSVVVIIVNLHFTRHDFWPRNIAPAPELRRGRTGDTRDGGLVPGVLNRDLPAFACGKRRGTSLTITLALEQLARFARPGGIDLLNATGDDLDQARLVGFAKRGHGNGLLRAINGDGLQRRLRAQRLDDGARETLLGIFRVRWFGSH